MFIEELYDKVKALDIDKVAHDAMEASADDLTEENKKQLLAGYNEDGTLIGDTRPYQNPDYAFYKANKNPLPGLGNPDLKDTGAFYNGIRTEISGDTVKIESSDSKNDDLQKKYGDIFGLGGEFKDEFIRESLQPAFLSEIEQATGLKPT